MLNFRRGWGADGQLRQRVNVYCVSALFELIADINSFLRVNKINKLIAVLANDDRSEVAGDVMPLDAVIVLVVQYRQTGLVVELLQALNSDSNIVFCFDRSLLNTLVIVGLGLAVFSSGAPVSVRMGLVCGGDTLIAGTCPEPTLHVDRL